MTMMVVMAVMMAGLHLNPNLTKGGGVCQCVPGRFAEDFCAFLSSRRQNWWMQGCDLKGTAVRFWISVLACVLLGLVLGAKTVEPVDINRASVAELLTVKGMTEVWAKRIVRFRPYRTKLDLVERGVVTPEVYQRIREGVVAHRDTSEQAVQPGRG
jgi:hypothetical protein